MEREPARAWREREFTPVPTRSRASLSAVQLTRQGHAIRNQATFVSCCLQAGISLATIASWCGTSIQMISRTYGCMISRYEGTPPVELALQYRTAKPGSTA